MPLPDALHVITLDPEGERYREFAARNAHLGPVNVFKGIRGADIPHEERAASGLITEEVLAAGAIHEGMLGCAASHRALWHTVAASSAGAVIMEDDVITHPNLTQFLDDNQKLLRHADIVYFTANTNSVLACVSMQGLTTYEAMAPLHPDPAWIETAFARTAVTDAKHFRLLNCFGMCCYWVSPQGAARLLELVFPLTLEPTRLSFSKDLWPGSIIDGRINAFLPTLRSFIIRPFLAYTPNIGSTTTDQKINL